MSSDPREAPAKPTGERPDLDQARLADARLAEALRESGAADPRIHCRQLLASLKAADPGAYAKGVAYYQQTLVPSIAGGAAGALDAWLAYAVRLAELAVEGRTTAVDAEGRGRPFQSPGDLADLVLRFPSDARRPPLRLWTPARPSAAQTATSDWLIDRRRELRR